MKNSAHPEIKKTFTRIGLRQIIKRPTRTKNDTRSLIDIIATSHENNINNYIVFSNSISDHDLTGASIKKTSQKFKPRTIHARNFAKYDHKAYENDLAELPLDLLREETDFNEAWNRFKDLLCPAMNIHAPIMVIKVRGRVCPWLTSEIKRAMIERDYYLRKARGTEREVYLFTYKRLRNDVTLHFGGSFKLIQVDC